MTIEALNRLSPLLRAIIEKDEDTVNKLILSGSDVINLQDDNGRSPLHLAAEFGAVDIADLLLLSGARVNKKDAHWNTPLHRAVANGHHNVVDVLLRHSADVTQRDRNWQNALHIAAASDHSLSVQFLLAAMDSDTINSGDKDGLTPLDYAAYYGNDEGWTPLHYAGCNGSVGCSKCLFRVLDPESLTVVDGRGNTPVHVAAEHGSVSVLKLFLKHGGYPNAQNRLGLTPLHLACGSEDERRSEKVQLLLNHGANPNIPSYTNGFRPIHFLASTGNIQSLHHLVQAGVHVNGIDYGGNSALHVAGANGHEQFVAALIQFAVDHSMFDLFLSQSPSTSFC